MVNSALQLDGSLSFSTPTTETLASDILIVTQVYMIVEAESGTTDDLATITTNSFLDAGYVETIWLKAASTHTITVKDGTGNIQLGSGADFTLSGDTLLGLVYDGTNWNDVSSSASAISTPVSIALGGTGQTTQTAAFDALAPTTTTQNAAVHWDGSNYIARKQARASYIVDETTNYTTSSTSFADIDGTKLALTITTNGGDVLCGFQGNVQITSLSDYVYFNVYESVAAADYFPEDGIIFVRHTVSSGVARIPIGFVVRITGLSAGSHTFKLRWKVNTGGDAILFSGQALADRLTHPQFWVMEF